MLFKDKIQRSLAPLKVWVMGESLLLSGRMASWEVRSRKVIPSLQEVEFRVNSQWGQDGIIDWLIERAEIPSAAQTFIEFGVEDYRQSNTRFLLQNRNWRGLIMDGNPAVDDAVRRDGLAWRYDLTVRVAFITRENINDLIEGAGFGGEIGLLCIDIDGNDYWVWEALDTVRPILCVCEYNAVLGDVHPICTAYDEHFSRTRAHASNLYFGASIAALRSLAAKKGYRFVGTNSAGNDAFFVREDYAFRFIESSLKSIQSLPSLFRESRDGSGQNTFIGGVERLAQIASSPVVDVETGNTVTLGDLVTVYSDEWMQLMTGRAAGSRGAKADPEGSSRDDAMNPLEMRINTLAIRR